MEHEKPKPPAWIIGLLIVFLLLLFGAGVVGIVGFVTYKRIEAVERERAMEAKMRAVEARERAIVTQRAAEAANLPTAGEPILVVPSPVDTPTRDQPPP